MCSLNLRKRTKSREFALQILYQMDITHDSYADCLDTLWNSHAEEEMEPEVKNFTAQLVRGVWENREVINKKISEYANNWEMKRMAVVDRNILRLGCYELLFCQDIPPKVSINEAIELAKKYSNLEAGKFVNGILDKIKLEKNS